MDKQYINFLESQLKLSYYKNIQLFIQQEIINHKTIYPNQKDIYRCFEETDFDKMKVILFGQDPYHSKGVADGLAFSTNLLKTPPSLLNIFKEIKNEYPDVLINSNNLITWAKQGILLMNTCLTVEEGKPNSHSKIGWDIFIANFIQFLNEKKEFLIFVLWGNNARKLKPLISNKFLILESPH
ncbi:MAG: uracil-DNA glycosylase, partial [Metamycoplasmataceae bacterium]